jgi:dihydrodipicolinate synthase/N-acetylneuraminate lyase
VAKPYLISAIGTPLEDDECLHGERLRAHLEQQRAANIDGILVAGTMGLLQMLRDQTYQQLVEESSRLWSPHGELLVGIGDASLARTRDRFSRERRLFGHWFRI